ncbi:MAG: fatty acyl-AMP ligase [Pirellulales bacterium]|nr:fatty acyl-AMP ligase [Pirellulales bacterium]
MADESLPPCRNLADVLRRRAHESPARRAYTFLADGEADERHLSYGELDARARAIAVRLRSAAALGERALLLFPSGLEFIEAFFGCLYAGVIAVPVFPPRPHERFFERDLHRLGQIIRDAAPRVLLTTHSIQAMAGALAPHLDELDAVAWLPVEEGSIEDAGAWSDAQTPGDAPALLQYTSGSTSEPKGVVVTHANLLANEEMVRQAMRFDTTSCMVSWLPLFHDMGLIGGILQPCYTGFPCVFMSPEMFLVRPVRWLQALSRYQGTAGGAPNFAYDLCVRKTTPDERRGLDLSPWTVAYNGAEPIRAETLERFTETFAPYGFRREALFPVYGLAEATLFVAGGEYLRPPVIEDFAAEPLRRGAVLPHQSGPGEVRRLVGCPLPTGPSRVAIVDPETLRRAATDAIGEIWLSGPHVAGGYWQQPRASDETFRAQVVAEEGTPHLRTGDVGFIRAGALYITGRMKDLIITEGRNHYPHDIELSVEQSHDACRPGCCAAFAVEGETEQLVIVQELRAGTPEVLLPEIDAVIRRVVSEEHQMRAWAVVLIEPGTIPKTSSGKIQRNACRRQFSEGTLKLYAPGQSRR